MQRAIRRSEKLARKATKQLKQQERRWEELTTLNPITRVRVLATAQPIKDALVKLYKGKKRRAPVIEAEKA